MRKIPTVVGLGLVVMLLVGAAVVNSVLPKTTSLFSRASAATYVLSPGAANVTDSSFAVYWLTEKSSPGTVLYGEDPDQLQKSIDGGEDSAHLVNIINLKPGVKYYYRVAGDNSQPLEVTTAISGDVAVTSTVYGKVLGTDDQPLASGVVVSEITADSVSRRFAALSKTDGTFVLPVAGVSTGQNEVVTITSLDGLATVTCQTGKDKSLPTVKINQSLDCQAKPEKQATPAAFLAPAVSQQTASSGGELQVLLEEGEIVSTARPTISGKAGPYQTVKIVVRSDTEYSGTVKADSDGSWTWTPPANLSPGEHTATITVTNPDGTVQTVTRNFTVTAGSPILPVTSGTPSAQPSRLACVNGSCQRVDGPGANTCGTNADCVPKTRKVCQNNACVVVPGPGADSCGSDTDCKPVAPLTPPATGAVENTLLVVGAGLLLLALSALARQIRL